MLYMLASSRTALIVRHWFEIDLDDASMEHGCRVELRERAPVEHRGSESAAQIVSADQPLWRADLFDRLGDEPGSFRAAHYHPAFDGNEPCDRVWDSELTAAPWTWLRGQLLRAGSGTDGLPVPPQDAEDFRGMADHVVTTSQRFSPTACGSRAECYRLTRDEREAVRLMVVYQKDPSRLDKDAVSLWTKTDSSAGGRCTDSEDVRLNRPVFRGGSDPTEG